MSLRNWDFFREKIEIFKGHPNIFKVYAIRGLLIAYR